MGRNGWVALVVAAGVCGIVAGAAARNRGAAGRVRGTPHDLSGRSGAPDAGSCPFCHTGHMGAAAGPLWNVTELDRGYRTYANAVTGTRAGQPAGATKMCLSCHDGMVAPTVRRFARPDREAAPLQLPPTRRAIGADLSIHHPVSIPFRMGTAAARAGLVPPETAPSGLGGSVREDLLDSQGYVQCTSCHDAHGNEKGHFLVIGTDMDRLCRTCHAPRDFELSAHSTEGRMGRSGGCLACHTSHDAAQNTPLLRAPEPAACAPCHPDPVARAGLDGVHGSRGRRMERGPARRPTCSTCHDPHLVRPRVGFERRLISDPRDRGGAPPRLLDAGETPYNGLREPNQAATGSSTFCLYCHDGTWAGAANIRAELRNDREFQSEFVAGGRSLHRVHGPDSPTRRGVSCTYCHDAHGSPGTLGQRRGALLYPWLNVREFPYRDRGSCASGDPAGRCH